MPSAHALLHTAGAERADESGRYSSHVGSFAGFTASGGVVV